VCDSAAIYALTILTCALAIAGYLATRLIAFPLLQDDVGNWLEPLGVVSILAEGFAVLTAIIALRTTSPSLAGSHVRTRLEGPGEPLVGVQRRDLECEPLSGVITARRGPSRRSSHRRASDATAGARSNPRTDRTGPVPIGVFASSSDIMPPLFGCTS